jgi:hypothetical protein
LSPLFPLSKAQRQSSLSFPSSASSLRGCRAVHPWPCLLLLMLAQSVTSVEAQRKVEAPIRTPITLSDLLALEPVRRLKAQIGGLNPLCRLSPAQGDDHRSLISSQSWPQRWLGNGEVRIGGTITNFGRLLSSARATSASCLQLTPPEDAGLDCLPRCRVPPLPVCALTGEWKDVSSNMILGHSLHRQPRAGISVSLEVPQSGSSCHHALAPAYSNAQ